MKLGISYNLFDGEELLKYSIKYIRNSVDYISVVYQEVSNFGDKCTDELLPLLHRLNSAGQIDELYLYTPIVDNRQDDTNYNQEVEKRNIGLELSRKNGCTHHMTMDVDEFYTPEQFEYMKRGMLQMDYFSGVCQHRQYYKDSIYQLSPPENEYIATIYKILPETKYIYNIPCVVPIDATRKTNNKDYRIFSRPEVEMHHMSFVRKDIRKKLMNHQCRRFLLDKIDMVAKYYETWKYPEPVMWAGGNFLKVIQVPRQFEIYV